MQKQLYELNKKEKIPAEKEQNKPLPYKKYTATEYNKNKGRRGNVASVEVEELEISNIGVVSLVNQVLIRQIKGD